MLIQNKNVKDNSIKTFLISGEFNDDLLKDFYEFHSEIVADGDPEAIIYINSFGGYISCLNTILGLMATTNTIFHTVNLSESFSAACLLCGMGGIRWASPLSTFLFHDSSTYHEGNKQQIRERVEWEEEYMKPLFEMFSKRTKKPLKWWLDKAYVTKNNDLCFTPKQALEYGVIDIIGIPKLIKQHDCYIEYPQEFLDRHDKTKKVESKTKKVKD